MKLHTSPKQCLASDKSIVRIHSKNLLCGRIQTTSAAKPIYTPPGRKCATVCKAQTEQGGSSTASSDYEAKKSGRTTYRPQTYTELVNDAVTSVAYGMKDGLTRMEVEFPAVSVDGYKGSSDLFIDANIQLALAAGKQLHTTTGKKVHLIVPDAIEYRRAIKLFKSALEMTPGVTFGHLDENKEPDMFSGLINVFGGGDVNGGIPPDVAAQAADVFITINATTVELVDVEKYVNETVKDRVLVVWNMELDTLRADLGLLGFPSKDLQYRFLSTIKPVFYIRQRDYSKTVAVAPFIINYSGALFREYPGPWQVMLRQDNGTYACVAENQNTRYNLGEFKVELTRAMGLDTELEGSAMQFLRSGYKNSTWWEDDKDVELSNAWRS